MPHEDCVEFGNEDAAAAEYLKKSIGQPQGGGAYIWVYRTGLARTGVRGCRRNNVERFRDGHDETSWLLCRNNEAWVVIRAQTGFRLACSTTWNVKSSNITVEQFDIKRFHASRYILILLHSTMRLLVKEMDYTVILSARCLTLISKAREQVDQASATHKVVSGRGARLTGV